jgi:hypothetical protein
MKYSGIYLISNPSTKPDDALHTVNTLIQAIETSQDATRQKPWSLSYRLFRNTIPRAYTNEAPLDADGKPTAFAHTYQHLLHLSSLSPSRTYVHVQPPADQGAGSVSSIPLQQQDAHSALLRHQTAALWSPRHVLAVQQGATYHGGPFTIHIGELRAAREAGAPQSPGVVVCISTTVSTYDAGDVAEDGENGVKTEQAEAIDLDCAQAGIRAFWNKIRAGRDLGRAEAREVMMAPRNDMGPEDEAQAAVRMWCEVLRLRG